MDPEQDSAPFRRSYGCSFGCGNPYDYIVVSVADGTAEMLCLPCYVRLAVDMIAAVTDADDPKVKAAMSALGEMPLDFAPGPAGRPRGANAPATATDDDVLDAFEDIITTDDLPPEFR
jgi:hypothetical protein